MKRSATLVLALAFAAMTHTQRAFAGSSFGSDEGTHTAPRCWIASAHLKNIDAHLPNPSASYVIQGRCETYLDRSGDATGHSTFDTGQLDSQITWTAQGTYQPVEKNTWEDVTLTQKWIGIGTASGVVTAWMLCQKDPWLVGDPSACGVPGLKTSGDVDHTLADVYRQALTSLTIPLTARLSSAQRRTLNDEYKAAVLAATKKKAAEEKKARDVKVVAFSTSDKVAQNAFNMGPAPKAPPRPNYPPYGAVYTPNAVPALKANQTVTIGIKLLNASSSNWPANGIYHLAYHWKAGAAYAVFDGERTFLPTAVASGGSIALNAKVVAPGKPGVYVLQWDLVQEGVAWFSQKGVPTKDQSVSVTP